MKRSLADLEARRFDLLVVGGGITGAFTAWEAARRGITVALVEKGDFGGGTSANSLKVIHGGFRRLKSGDLAGVRRGIEDRREYLRLAPHLVRPLPVVIPLYGQRSLHRIAGKCAVALYDLIGCDRNLGVAIGAEIAQSEFISPDTVARRVPVASREFLAGGVVFHDAQVVHTERLTLGVVQSARNHGVTAVNYVAAEDIEHKDNRVCRVLLRDALTGRRLSVFTRSVIVAAGPWGQFLSPRCGGRAGSAQVPLARAINLVVRRRWSPFAFALPGRGRFYFFTPWNGMTLVGTRQKWSGDFSGNTDGPAMEAEAFRSELNAAYPSLAVQNSDIAWVHCGWVPAKGPNVREGDADLAEDPIVTDHGRQGGIRGCLSVVGVKYTGAPRLARRLANWVDAYLGNTGKPAPAKFYSGGITDLDGFISASVLSNPQISRSEIRRLIQLYGTEYGHVLTLGREIPGGLDPISPAEPTTRAEVAYAIRSEMAMALADVVYRRTFLGAAGRPSPAVLEIVAAAAAKEAGWSEEETARQIHSVRGEIPEREVVA